MRVHSPKLNIVEQQADALLSQANPVSTTLYTVLNTVNQARIISIAATITWAVTQPDPLEVVVTIDGQSIIFLKNNPVTATPYYAVPSMADAANAQTLLLFSDFGSVPFHRSMILEGRSIKIESRVTWAVTQPTPLVVRVKYAKW